ncbi:hypothetical protein INT45_011355 [Circinella minor]|uniref:Uncharacterized protein n=1 Tax=Circinella minor TaxID=1195481 RepID=A0A8H7RIA4_9FUNG|nr:hypothetical protein INT45_011355 [Circinella minor]
MTEGGARFWQHCQALKDAPQYKDLQSKFDVFCKTSLATTDYVLYVPNGPMFGGDEGDSQPKSEAKTKKHKTTKDGPNGKLIKYIQDQVRSLYNEQAPSFGQLKSVIPWTDIRNNTDRYIVLDSIPEGVKFAEPSKELKPKNDLGKNERILLAKALERGQVILKKKQIL